MYGRDVPHLSPRYLNATGSTQGGTVTVTVSFVPESVVDGLAVVGGVVCPGDVPPDECSYPSIQINGGVWVNASVAVGPGPVMVLTAPAPPGALPTASSYAYSPWPVATLFSRAGFPVLPWNAPVY